MKRINKKGFTLVEILAVVAILAILGLLIVANILKDVEDSKDEYNKKLEKQLVVAGKSYYTAHKEDLPTLTNGKTYAYITVPEMQSNKYITNQFVDSEGRECSPSYVYVKQQSYNSKHYQYIPCLVCQDDNGNAVSYSKDPYCNVGNWNDKMTPECNETDNLNLKYKEQSTIKLKGVKDYIDSEKTKEGKIISIVITNNQTGDYYPIDTSKLSNAEIQNIDIKEYFKKHFKEDDEADYEVTIVDMGGNNKTCATFSTVAGDACPCTQEGNSVTFENVKAYLGFKGLYYVQKGSTQESSNIISNKYVGAKIIKKETVTIPYGSTIYFKDNENNRIDCNCKIKAKPGYPHCEWTKIPDTNTFVGKNGYNIEAKCTLCQEAGCKNVKIKDLSKIRITSSSPLGSISNMTHNANSNGEARDLIIKFKYTPRNNVSGYETMTFGAGVVENPSDTSKINEELPPVSMKIDTVPPKLVITPSGSTGAAKNGGTGYKNSVKVTITCQDQGDLQSGISLFKVNNVSRLAPTYTETRTTRGNHTFTATCTDKSTPKNSSSGNATYRVILNTRNKMCGIEHYKTCATSACGCKTRARSCSRCGCASYSTHYYSTCNWYCKGKGSSSYRRSTGSCSYAGQTYYNSGAQCRCSCSTHSYSTCNTCSRCSSASCIEYNSCEHKNCGIYSYKSCWY